MKIRFICELINIKQKMTASKIKNRKNNDFVDFLLYLCGHNYLIFCSAKTRP